MRKGSKDSERWAHWNGFVSYEWSRVATHSVLQKIPEYFPFTKPKGNVHSMVTVIIGRSVVTDLCL